MGYSTFVIARNTYRECVRQPIFFILTTATLVIIGTYPGLTGFVFREQEKLVRDGALATILFFGWITAVLCASHAISKEIETGTVLLVLSKPVNRLGFIIAKVAGILAALLLFVWVNGLATLMALRTAKDQFRIDMTIFIGFFIALAVACLAGGVANYVKRMSFPSVASHGYVVTVTLVAIGVYFLPVDDYGRKWGSMGKFDHNLALAVVMIGYAVLAMGVLATILSTRLNLVANFLVCGVIFLIGAVNEWFTASVRAMTRSEVLDAMNSSFILLVPLLVFLWIWTSIRFSERKNTRIGKFELHASFATLVAATLTFVTVGIVRRVSEEEPPLVMKAASSVVWNVKDSIVWVLHRATPDWQLFFYADALSADAHIPMKQVVLGCMYLIVFTVMIVTLGSVLFAGREVGQQVQQG